MFSFQEIRNHYEFVKMVITNEFSDNCITATNTQGEENKEFMNVFPQGISDSEKRQALLKGYLAIE